ncbi:MAG TPA: mechanosensitive ion channel family protein [Bacteroidia bacterium]|nr:mechanosensitive ion channel family protein [Bacteroidia bacterium]
MKTGEFLKKEFIAPNTVEDWLWFAGIIFMGLLLRSLFTKGFSKLVFRFFNKKESEQVGFTALLALVKKPVYLFILLVLVYIAAHQLTWPPHWKMSAPDKFGVRMTLERGLFTLIEFSFTWVLLRLTDFFGLLLKARAEKTPGKEDDQLVPFLRESIKVIIVIFAIFFLLGSVFHLNVASLIAGLGIGGIAVALAAKESLENLLGSFTIFLDKPFTVGDTITYSGQACTIESIGIRSTCIRAEDRSLITVPNRKIVENEVINLTLRNALRVKMIVSLTYSSTPEQLRAFILDAGDLLMKHPGLVHADSKASLFDLASSSVDVLLLYFISKPEQEDFLRIKEEVNFLVMELVKKHGLVFAFPSTSVYIEKN